MKRIISIILVLVMLFSISCFADFYNNSTTNKIEIPSIIKEYEYKDGDTRHALTPKENLKICNFVCKLLEITPTSYCIKTKTDISSFNIISCMSFLVSIDTIKTNEYVSIAFETNEEALSFTIMYEILRSGFNFAIGPVIFFKLNGTYISYVDPLLKSNNYGKNLFKDFYDDMDEFMTKILETVNYDIEKITDIITKAEINSKNVFIIN